MSDATLCTVGVQDGVGVMMEYMVTDSLKERCKPTLFVNKMDISIMVLEKTGEELYQDLSKVVENMNVALAGAEKLNLKGFNLVPELGIDISCFSAVCRGTKTNRQNQKRR